MHEVLSRALKEEGKFAEAIQLRPEFNGQGAPRPLLSYDAAERVWNSS